MLTKVLKYLIILVPLVTLTKDKPEHSVKLSKDFVKKIKHEITEEHFPIYQLNRFFTVSAQMIINEWNKVKNIPSDKTEFIKKMKDVENTAVDEDYLKQKEKDNED